MSKTLQPSPTKEFSGSGSSARACVVVTMREKVIQAHPMRRHNESDLLLKDHLVSALQSLKQGEQKQLRRTLKAVEVEFHNGVKLNGQRRIAVLKRILQQVTVVPFATGRLTIDIDVIDQELMRKKVSPLSTLKDYAEAILPKIPDEFLEELNALLERAKNEQVPDKVEFADLFNQVLSASRCRICLDDGTPVTLRVRHPDRKNPSFQLSPTAGGSGAFLKARWRIERIK